MTLNAFRNLLETYDDRTLIKLVDSENDIIEFTTKKNINIEEYIEKEIYRVSFQKHCIIIMLEEQE